MEARVSVMTLYPTGIAFAGPDGPDADKSTQTFQRAQMAASGRQREIVK